jgi:hypothetical protein
MLRKLLLNERFCCRDFINVKFRPKHGWILDVRRLEYIIELNTKNLCLIWIWKSFLMSSCCLGIIVWWFASYWGEPKVIWWNFSVGHPEISVLGTIVFTDIIGIILDIIFFFNWETEGYCLHNKIN